MYSRKESYNVSWLKAERDLAANSCQVLDLLPPVFNDPSTNSGEDLFPTDNDNSVNTGMIKTKEIDSDKLETTKRDFEELLKKASKPCSKPSKT